MQSRLPYKGPYPFGHECVAQVIACAEGVRDVKVGDTVIVPWSIACGQCATCHKGLRVMACPLHCAAHDSQAEIR